MYNISKGKDHPSNINHPNTQNCLGISTLVVVLVLSLVKEVGVLQGHGEISFREGGRGGDRW